MMTKVCNLGEIGSSLPVTFETPRRFTMDKDNPLWVDMDRIAVARAFDGILLVQDEDSRMAEKRMKFVELFLEGGGLSVVVPLNAHAVRMLANRSGDEKQEEPREQHR